MCIHSRLIVKVLSTFTVSNTVQSLAQYCRSRGYFRERWPTSRTHSLWRRMPPKWGYSHRNYYLLYQVAHRVPRCPNDGLVTKWVIRVWKRWHFTFTCERYLACLLAQVPVDQPNRSRGETRAAVECTLTDRFHRTRYADGEQASGLVERVIPDRWDSLLNDNFFNRSSVLVLWSVILWLEHGHVALSTDSKDSIRKRPSAKRATCIITHASTKYANKYCCKSEERSHPINGTKLNQEKKSLLCFIWIGFNFLLHSCISRLPCSRCSFKLTWHISTIASDDRVRWVFFGIRVHLYKGRTERFGFITHKSLWRAHHLPFAKDLVQLLSRRRNLACTQISLFVVDIHKKMNNSMPVRVHIAVNWCCWEWDSRAPRLVCSLFFFLSFFLSSVSLTWLLAVSYHPLTTLSSNISTNHHQAITAKYWSL